MNPAVETSTRFAQINSVIMGTASSFDLPENVFAITPLQNGNILLGGLGVSFKTNTASSVIDPFGTLSVAETKKTLSTVEGSYSGLPLSLASTAVTTVVPKDSRKVPATTAFAGTVTTDAEGVPTFVTTTAGVYSSAQIDADVGVEPGDIMSITFTVDDVEYSFEAKVSLDNMTLANVIQEATGLATVAPGAGKTVFGSFTKAQFVSSPGQVTSIIAHIK